MDLFSAALQSADMRLAQLWVDLDSLFRDEAAQDAEQVIAFVVGLLRRRGVDTSEMEDTLKRTRRYAPGASQIPLDSAASADTVGHRHPN